MKNKIITKGKSINKGAYILHSFIATWISLVFFCGVSFAQTTSNLNTEWLTFNGGLDAIRFSPLTQIAPKNVASIVMVGEYTITDTVRFQTGPVMIGKTLFFTTAFSTYAVDAVTYYTPVKLYVSALMQSFGKFTANDANTAHVNPHTVFDLDIGHEGISFGNNKRTRLILSGGISNIFNIHYISSVTINATADRYYEPAPGRSFFLNVKLAYR